MTLSTEDTNPETKRPSSFASRPLFAILALTAVLAPVPAHSADTPDAEPTQAERVAQRDAMKQRAAERDAAQKRDYLKAVPQPFGEDVESDIIKMRTAREWYMLTYPTGTLPSQPWDKARGHVQRRVPDAPPWAGPGIDFRSGTTALGTKAAVTPSENTWTAVGPRPLDSVGTTNNAYTYGIVTGRVGADALAVDPTNPSVAYAGFVAGGLWKTTNLGAANVDWTPLWDDKDFVTQSVSSILIDPTDSNTIWVGTGDWAANDQFSAGIMKSTDAGATWTQLGADVFTPYSQVLPAGGNRWNNQNIKVIRVDPKNPLNVLVGTRYDLYSSNDGGASWSICGFGANYTDPQQGVGTAHTVNRISDIVLDTRGAATVVYAAVGYIAYNGNGNNGVYRFTWPATGCPQWPGDFETLFAGFPALTGNGVNTDAGGSLTGRIELAQGTGTDGGMTLYAQVGNADTLGVEGTYVLRPDGGSTTWTKLAGSTTLTECDGSAASTGQDWYDLFLEVDPSNDKVLYVGHIDAFKSQVDSSYSSMSSTNLTNVYATGCPEYGVVHPDQHAFAFVGTSGQTFLLGNDGGVYYNDQAGALAGWQQVNDDFNTTQFYGGQIGANFAGGGSQWLFGGMQDNGSASWDASAPDATWTARSVGGDGFYTSFDVINGSETSGWWITEYVYGDMYCSDTGAQGPFEGANFFSGCGPSYSGSPDWSTPFLVDTLHCNTSSGCSNYVVGGDYVYAATSYKRSAPQWARISNSQVKTSAGSILTVNTAPSHPGAVATGTSDGKVWWTEQAFTGTSCTQAAANTTSFSCSANAGTWVDADAANAVLPNRVVHQVAFDPNDHHVFYAAVGGFDTNTPATPGHLFQLTSNGSSITVVDKTGNLPDVPASSVAVNPHNRKQVFVGTYFGFYYTDDIDVASPTWVRYQTGMPNTVIKHLTIDRGPASDPIRGTTLAAFTYGRGVFVLKLPTGTTGGNAPPTADFSYTCTDLACDFTDLSSDPDGTIASWAWDFGDGNGSTTQSPSHSFAADGTYTVALTVTDDQGAPASTSQDVTVTTGTTGGGITLSASGYKVKGVQHTDLTWSGATTANVDVVRGGAVVATTANDGAYTDNIGVKGTGSYVYQVCEAGTTNCSDPVTVVF